MGSGDYYERYGLWGNPKWTGPVYHGKYGNGVRIHHSKSVKVDYVASWGGYFASFNIKTDRPKSPGEVEVDIQDCFGGFGEGEAFYISYSMKASDKDITRLTLKNNITAFTGAEALQTDNLAEGSVIENNVSLGSATFYRHPFQARFQDNLHQLSFVEGGVMIRNNILVGTNGALHNFRHRDAGAGRTSPSADKPVTLQNNFYGFGRTTMGYMWQGDGITPYVFKDNVYGDISVPMADDTLSAPAPDESGFFHLGNSNNPITFDGNIYPPGRELYFVSRGDGSNVGQKVGGDPVTGIHPRRSRSLSAHEALGHLKEPPAPIRHIPFSKGFKSLRHPDPRGAPSGRLSIILQAAPRRDLDAIPFLIRTGPTGLSWM